MVKADLTRDYYGDLELQPGADIADIKKQFKKLALTYHPDRNPGRESEVTAKFQKIQSAHEVLTDAQERAKYDNNRNRGSNRFGNSYAGSSGVRGNPWSDVGSQFPPPPKHPTARQTPQRPSAGAERYNKFQAPKQAPHQAANEGAGARQKTYEAWESMRTKQQPKPQPQTTQPGPGRTWKAPQPPPRGTPQSGQQESNSRAHAPPPKTRPGFEEFRQETAPGVSPFTRSHSTNATNRKGFMPNTPGGDEPAAPMGAYFTQRNKPAVAPDLPAREPPPPREHPSRQKPPREQPPREPASAAHTVGADPLRQFRESAAYPQMEPRISTPYATHGGEKLNPFESSNLHRSKSTREPSQIYDAEGHVPRTGSDPNLASPHRSKSFVDRGASKSKHHKVPSVEIETDSSDDGPQFSSRPFGKPRVRKATNGAPPQVPRQTPDSAPQSSPQRKPSKISQFRQWYKENPDQEPPLNGFPADGPPLRSGQTLPDTNGEPSMYAYSAPLQPEIKRASTYPVRLPTVSETITSSNSNSTSGSDAYDLASMKYPVLFPNGALSVAPPSGITEEPISLTPFEGLQRSLVNQLLLNKRRACSSNIPSSTGKSESHYINQNLRHHGSRTSSVDAFSNYRDSAEAGSPSKKSRSRVLRSEHSYDPSQARAFWSGMEKIKSATNNTQRDRFSFNVNDDTVKTSSPGLRLNGFSNSAENISTKFSTQDWNGTFAAGTDYFKPEQKPSGVPSRSRAQSGSRSRGRSPIKPRPVDPHYMQQRGSESEPTVESPSGTTFSPTEWADTFKPQTFAPPPVPTAARQVPTRKRTVPTVRQTMGGNAAVVDDGETSDEKPLFTGRKPPPTPAISSPDAMDVDTPPVTNTIPHFESAAGENLNVNTTSPKRAAAPSQCPIDEAALKVNFDDMEIQDLLSSLEMPRTPTPPALPQVSQGSRPTQAAYEDYQIRFAKYMTTWDLYNKQFMLHLVARKNQNDNLGTNRWLDEQGLETYRRGLKEDGVVLSRWAWEKERHEQAVRDWVVLREKMKEGASGESRPRKKTH